MSNEKTVPEIPPERAAEAVQRLINSHFGMDNKARATIPADPANDDDLIASAYVMQSAARISALTVERDLLRMRHPFGTMYDALRKAQEENAALKAQVARLSAPVSDAEWSESYWSEDGGVRGFIDSFIAARAAPPQS